MGIGIALPAGPDGIAAAANAVDTLIDEARQAAAAGLDEVWFAQRLDVDAIAVAGLVGREVPGIRVGTSVVPIYPRHPIVLAGQAQTAQAATGGRFTLGIGLSAAPMVTGVFGAPYDRPIRHLRDYLTALASLLADGTADVHGPTLTADTGKGWSARVPGAEPSVPVIVAAMGPQALRATGELADGTLPYLAGPKTIAGHILPIVSEAAEAAGRPAPRIIAAFPGVVTADPASTRVRAEQALAFYRTIPSYRAVLDREGVGHAVELAAIGDEDTLAEYVEAYFAAGATDVVVTNTGFGTPQDRLRTWELLGRLARARGVSVRG
ncbi:TIGR03564 family F420-dependent LLM class oxidoreductase [Actinoallomurus sp. CA-150999]|uniref:TIGR03564 family F420-dependent LLM class oxidoreductase n=1 Tax=Actinoallomurus sp. CA-150999 TaxID=3239887 RepID=UPI003D8D45DD